MNDYVILTDSSCDIEQSKLDQMGIDYVPLMVEMDSKIYVNYADWREISPEKFFGALRNGSMAKTSAVNADSFKNAMIPRLEAGLDVLYVGFSSGLSGTYNSGRIAVDELRAKYPDRKIIAIDTLCASLGEGLIVTLAYEKKKSGATIEELQKYLEDIKLHICHWFTVSDLMFLQRGGRVSKATAIIGATLGIKPVMHVDNEGHLVKVEVARGRKASIKRLAAKMKASQISTDYMFISHGDCLEEAQQLADIIQDELNIKNVYINCIGPVIGAHSGPGTLALFFVGNER